MKIDYDLLRKILIQSNEYFNGTLMPVDMFINKNFPNENKSIMYEHLKCLIESRLLDGKIANNISVKSVTIPYGYDFLQTISNETVWEAIKEKLNPIDECPLRLVVDIAYNTFAENRLK